MDYSFYSLKKYVSLLNGYTNKSQYTAPEKLFLKGMVVEGADEASDCYSLGMIFWYSMLTKGNIVQGEAIP